MKVSVSNKGYTLSGISADELKVVMYLLETAKERCFREYDENNAMYFDGGDFVASLNKDERQNFHNFVDGFWNGHKKMEANFIKKNQ